MKRFLGVLMVVIISISVFIVPVSANNELSVVLNGELLEFDVKPQIINGRTMVPMRKIFEALGATVDWDGNAQKITAKRQDTTVVMQINNNILTVNGNVVALDVPPQLVDGRTLVPVRAVAESLDTHVIWDDSTDTVLLSTYIAFDAPIQTFDYLCDWLLEYGEAFANHTYIGWEVADGVEVQVRCYPQASNGKNVIWFDLNTYDIDGVVTSVCIFPTYDGTGVYAMYDSLGDDFHINGDVNMEMHTDNYPLSCVECDFEGNYTEYGLLNETRERINFMLKECDILLSAYNTNVTLNTLGFKKH